MIPITPEIMGPGIEEDYQDALLRIEKLLALLKDADYSNDTPDGRTKWELYWLRQEITAGRLPLPVQDGWISTITYTHANGDLNHLPGFRQICEDLIVVLEEGLVKPRHTPVVIEMIDEVLPRIDQIGQTPAINLTDPYLQELLPDPLMAIKQELLQLKLLLMQNLIELPVIKKGWPAIAKMSVLGGLDDATDQMLMTLGYTLKSGWRPAACRKGPLAPPNPEPLRREARPPQANA